MNYLASKSFARCCTRGLSGQGEILVTGNTSKTILSVLSGKPVTLSLPLASEKEQTILINKLFTESEYISSLCGTGQSSINPIYIHGHWSGNSRNEIESYR